ncbi:MAG: thrombospondin type 3 repeat-containing protein [Bradymonadales bacterium]|nr:thrombospondin type 3 repeat-containing protein [Bradymonadales bacterium]
MNKVQQQDRAFWTRALAIASLLAVTSLAAPTWAEGSREIDGCGYGDTGCQVTQGLQGTTPLYVDILDAPNEQIRWQGQGTATVYDPDRQQIAILYTGTTVTPTANGKYNIVLSRHQYDVNASNVVTAWYPWDIAVIASSEEQLGRLSSIDWRFNVGNYDDTTDTSFYALIGGTAAVTELQLNGMASFVYQVRGNGVGILIDGESGPGRSVPDPGEGSGVLISIPADFNLYVNVPEVATFDLPEPTVSNFTFANGSIGCSYFTAGEGGTFTFDSNVDGTYHLICNLYDENPASEQFELVSGNDLTIFGAAVAGTNHVYWDGLDNDGEPIDPTDFGDPVTPDNTSDLPILHCKLWVTTGEFHYVGIDMETSFPGMRLYNVLETGIRSPLRMFWNDDLVQDNAVEMPLFGDDAQRRYGTVTSGPDGVMCGAYDSTPVPYRSIGQYDIVGEGDARAWGNFSANSKGNDAFLDTYSWVYDDDSNVVDLIVLASDADYDDDGLSDYVELCVTTTLYTDDDSDDDLVSDFIETQEGLPGIDTDGDGTIDGLDNDDDGDGILTVDEDLNDNDDPTDDDSDDDDIPNYLDDDDDDDTVPTLLEDVDGNDDPRNDDTDEDDIPDYLDPDDDGDNVPTAIEDPNGNGDPTDDDTDDDDIPNYLDDDDDGDGTPTKDEDPNDNDDPTDDDTDGDGIPNYLDANDQDGPLGDLDGDEILNEDDNCPEDANPNQEDMNEDGEGDACDDDIDGDGLDNDEDNCPEVVNPDQLDMDDDDEGDACDDDMDGDDVLNDDDNCPTVANADQADLNDDGEGDACDDDIDGDGLTNAQEADFGSDPRDPDTDDGGLLDADELRYQRDPLDPWDDILDGREVRGGSLFGCSAAGTEQTGGPAALGLLLVAVVCLATRRRRL